MTALRKTAAAEVKGTWTAAEHERFLEAIAKYPQGPWRMITEHVGTRSIKQVQTHAQKYQQKLLRHQRGLRKTKTKVVRPAHRVDTTTIDHFTSGCIVRKSYSQLHSATSGSPAPSSVSYSSDSPDSSSAPFSSMMAEPLPQMHAPFTTNDANYGYNCAFDAYCEPSPAAAHSYDSFRHPAHLDSGVEPMPYMYGYNAPALVWSEPEALALRETLEVLLV